MSVSPGLSPRGVVLEGNAAVSGTATFFSACGVVRFSGLVLQGHSAISATVDVAGKVRCFRDCCIHYSCLVLQINYACLQDCCIHYSNLVLKINYVVFGTGVTL